MVRIDSVPEWYGLSMAGASRIILTNGLYDPWYVGGVFENSIGMENNKQRGLHVFLMEGAAHHLDLRQPNTCDPPNVHAARRQIVGSLKCWVGQPLPPGTSRAACLWVGGFRKCHS